MASERLKMVVFMVVMVMGAMNMQSSVAQTHTVGGSLGWTIPAQDPNAYTTWAASQTFKVGDILVFNFTTGAHTAAEVTKAAYDACTTTSPISTWRTGPSSVTLNSSGPHYYICTITGHCLAGQKLAITVAAAASPPPAPTPKAAPPTPTPTPAPSTTPTPSPSPTPSPTPTPTPATTPSPSPSPASAPTPAGTTPPAPAPGSTTTPSTPAPGTGATPPGASDTPGSPSSASFLSAALPVTFLSIAMAFYY